MASSVSVPLALSLSSSTSSEGGFMKTYLTPSSPDSLTALTPCTSMSRMQTLPLSATASTAALEVPYMFPENSAVSMNSPSPSICSMVGRSEKL